MYAHTHVFKISEEKQALKDPCPTRCPILRYGFESMESANYCRTTLWHGFFDALKFSTSLSGGFFEFRNGPGCIRPKWPAFPMNLHTHTHTHTLPHTHTYTHTHTQIHAHTYIYMYTYDVIACIYTYVHTYVCIWIQLYLHTCICICVRKTFWAYP